MATLDRGRVAMLGHQIERRLARHYLGRVFATMASRVLGIRVYDTQCGAKVFRVTGALRAALSEPFLSRWAFDVELIGRLMAPPPPVAPPVPVEDMIEVPLLSWTHIDGSTLSVRALVRVLADLEVIRRDLARRARGHATPQQASKAGAKVQIKKAWPMPAK